MLPVSIAHATGKYEYPLWFGTFLLLVSQFMSLAIFVMAVMPNSATATTCEKSLAERVAHRSKARRVRDFPREFWLLVGIHVVMNNAHNIFNGISTDFILNRDSLAVETAAWLSSIESVGPIFFCSWVSWHVNRYGGRMYWMLFASVCSVLGFALLLCPGIPTAFCMVMLSFNTIILPTLLRSSIPMLLHPDMYGLGFGLYAALTGLGGNVNILVGWLKDVSGSYRSSVLLLMVMAILGVAMCLWTHCIDASRSGCLNLDREQLKVYEEQATGLLPHIGSEEMGVPCHLSTHQCPESSGHLNEPPCSEPPCSPDSFNAMTLSFNAMTLSFNARTASFNTLRPEHFPPS